MAWRVNFYYVWVAFSATLGPLCVSLWFFKYFNHGDGEVAELGKECQGLMSRYCSSPVV